MAYVITTDNNNQIYIRDLVTGNQRQVTFEGNNNTSCAWSRDGKKLAYAGYKNEKSFIGIIDVDGGAAEICDSCNPNLSNWTQVGSLNWAPGRFIMYQKPEYSKMESYDPKTKIRRTIGPTLNVGYSFIPIMSPRSDQFAFYWNQNVHNPEEGKTSHKNTGTWVSSLSGDKLHFMTPTFPIGWSPDGEWVYSWRMEQRCLVRTSVSTGETDSLFHVPEADVDGVTLSPDASQFSYLKKQETADVWLIEAVNNNK
jgi:hypothetical protein